MIVFVPSASGVFLLFPVKKRLRRPRRDDDDDDGSVFDGKSTSTAAALAMTGRERARASTRLEMYIITIGKYIVVPSSFFFFVDDDNIIKYGNIELRVQYGPLLLGKVLKRKPL